MVEDRPVGVGADLHRPGGLALVAEGVHVTDDRIADLVAGGLEDLQRADVDHLMDGRRQRDGRPGHLGDPGAPHSTRHHHVVGFDPAAISDHRLHPPVLGLDIQDLGVR